MVPRTPRMCLLQMRMPTPRSQMRCSVPWMSWWQTCSPGMTTMRKRFWRRSSRTQMCGEGCKNRRKIVGTIPGTLRRAKLRATRSLAPSVVASRPSRPEPGAITASRRATGNASAQLVEVVQRAVDRVAR